MSAPPYMKLYWADYHQDTRHLTRDEHGAYLLLLGEAWNRGGFLPDDDALLARWALATGEEWATLKPIIMAFFRPASKGRWRHKRISEELAAYDNVSRKRKEAGKRGGSTTRGNDKGNQEAIAKQKPTKPEPEPEPEVREEDSVASNATGGELTLGLNEPDQPVRSDPWDRDPDFGRLWDLCPPMMRRRAKSKANVWPEWLRAKKRALPMTILPAFARFKAMDADLPRTGGPGLHIWLRSRTWENWSDAAASEDPTASWGDGHWRAALRHFDEGGEWDASWGAPPGSPGCRVPPKLLIGPANVTPGRLPTEPMLRIEP